MAQGNWRPSTQQRAKDRRHRTCAGFTRPLLGEGPRVTEEGHIWKQAHAGCRLSRGGTKVRDKSKLHSDATLTTSGTRLGAPEPYHHQLLGLLATRLTRALSHRCGLGHPTLGRGGPQVVASPVSPHPLLNRARSLGIPSQSWHPLQKGRRPCQAVTTWSNNRGLGPVQIL